MRHVSPIALAMIAIALIMDRSTSSAQSTITVSNQSTLLNFPDQITFSRSKKRLEGEDSDFIACAIAVFNGTA